jgi:hypothetical protein
MGTVLEEHDGTSDGDNGIVPAGCPVFQRISATSPPGVPY